MVHRDIKPANIRISIDGAVKLLDFGVASSDRQDRSAHTGTDQMIGTFLYMAPECLTEGSFTPASDVFALGATLFESVGTCRLFQGKSVTDQVVMGLHPDRYAAFLVERLHGLNIDPKARLLLTKMLALDPTARPSGAEISAVCEDLSEDTEGVTLRRWCQAHTWPEFHPATSDWNQNQSLDGHAIQNGPRPPTATRTLGIGLLVGVSGTAVVTAAISLLCMVIGLGLWWAFQSPNLPIASPVTPDIQPVDVGPSRQPTRIVHGRRLRTASRPTGYQVTLVTKPTNAGRMRLKNASGVFTNGVRVPQGRYALQVDWGKGFKTRAQVSVSAEKHRFVCFWSPHGDGYCN